MAKNNLNFKVAVDITADKFKKNSRKVNKSLQTIKSNVLALSAAFTVGTLSMSRFIGASVDTVRELSRAQAVLRNVTGDSNSYAESLTYLNTVSKKYNAEIIGLTGNYSKFLATSKGANVSLEDTRNIFEAITQASTYFNLSADDTNGIMLALTQMMSKGKIQAEELRGQLGERLPGALSMMARSLGVTTSELDKLMEQGKLLSNEVLPKLAQQMKIETGGFDKNTIEGSINALKNAWTEMWSSPDIQKAFTTVINGLTTALTFVVNNFRDVMIVAMGVFVAVISNQIQSMMDNIKRKQDAILAQYGRTTNAVLKDISNIDTSKFDNPAIGKLIDKLKLLSAQANNAKVSTDALRDTLREIGLEGQSTKDIQNLNELVHLQKKHSTEVKALGREYGSRNNLSQDFNTSLGSGLNQNVSKVSLLSKVTNNFKRCMNSALNSISSFVKSNILGVLLGIITAIGIKLKDWHNEQKEINNLYEDTLKTLIQVNAKSVNLDLATKMLNEISLIDNKSKEYKNTINQINGLLGTQLKREEDIRKEIERRQQELIREARVRAGQERITELEGKKLAKLDKRNEYEKLRTEAYNSSINKGQNPQDDYFYSKYDKLYNNIDSDIKKIDSTIEGVLSLIKGDILTTKQDTNNTSGGVEVDKSQQDAIDKYNVSVTELNNQLARGVITQALYDERLKELNTSTLESVSKLNNLDVNGLQFVEDLKNGLDVPFDIKIDDSKAREAQDLYDSVTQSEIETLSRKYSEEKSLLEEFGHDTTKLTKKYIDEVTKMFMDKYEFLSRGEDLKNSKRDNTFDYRLGAGKVKVQELEFDLKKNQELIDY